MAETLPPMSFADCLAAIQNPNFSSYVVFSTAGSKAWKIATNLQKFMAALRVYLVKSAAESEVRTHFGLTAATKGIVFGFDDVVVTKLTKAKTQDALAVMNAIWDART